MQMIPNAAIINGTVTGIEPFPQQEGFLLLTILVSNAEEKPGMRFLGEDLADKVIVVLISDVDVKNACIEVQHKVNGIIKKVSPVLWRAVETSFQTKANDHSSSIKTGKKDHH